MGKKKNKSPKTTFKGFDADLRCRGHQYEVGRTETTDETPAACERGFHSCVNPADVLEFYPPVGPDGRPNRYAKVSPGGQTDTDETKTASQALTVVKEITLTELICLATTGDEAHSTTTGDEAHSTTTGDGAHSATTGDRAHSTTAGDSAHSATAGDRAHSTTAGNWANSATAGDRAHSTTTGYSAHSTTAGDSAHSTTAGDRAHSATSGLGCASVALGAGSQVRAGLGSWLVAAEHDDDSRLVRVATTQVDGNDIKPDTWYRLAGGQWVEHEDD